jgi:hypothetical protein
MISSNRSFLFRPKFKHLDFTFSPTTETRDRSTYNPNISHHLYKGKEQTTVPF